MEKIKKMMRSWRKMEEKMKVFELYESVISEDGERRKIMERLGKEEGDIIEELKNYEI